MYGREGVVVKSGGVVELLDRDVMGSGDGRSSASC